MKSIWVCVCVLLESPQKEHGLFWGLLISRQTHVLSRREPRASRLGKSGRSLPDVFEGSKHRAF